MKFVRTKIYIFILIVVVAILSGSAVYAFTSLDFTSRAHEWVKNNCTQSLLNSKSTNSKDKEITECFNFFKNIEQDKQISNLNDHKMPTLQSIAGNLGIYTGSDQFYNPTLNRIVLHTGAYLNKNLTTVYFFSSDCTGQGYIDASITDLQIYLWKLSNGSYWIVNMVHPDSPIQALSELVDVNNAPMCQSINTNVHVFPGTQVTIPFSDPIVLPLSLSND